MKTAISPIIEPEELMQIASSGSPILVDARGGEEAKARYDAKHLKGALFVDLDNQLAAIKDDPAQGGRHPLPSPTAFSKLLGTLGISKQSHVIVYDDKSAANAAARFWWMLVAAGHEKVQVLNGGFHAAEQAGFPLASGEETTEVTSEYDFEDWLLPLAGLEKVEHATQDDEFLIVDVRDAQRYAGYREPIDLIAGHIPSAVNAPFEENLDEEGRFHSPEKLKNRYLKLFEGRPAENVIVHCGSGVTACHSLLAAAYAGLDIPTLYVGSWSEWSRNEKPMVIR